MQTLSRIILCWTHFASEVEQLVWSIWLSVSLYFIWRSHIDQRGFYDILGNNFGFCFPGAPSPATLKVCPNSNSSPLGLSIHMSHSWLNVHLDLTRKRFLRTSSSGILAGGVWGFSRVVFVQTGEIGGFRETDSSTFQFVFVLSTLGVIHRLCIEEVFGYWFCDTALQYG